MPLFFPLLHTQETEENEDCFGVLVATRRLAAFYKIVDLSRYKLSVEFKELLEAGVNNSLCEGILENVIVCLRLDVMWAIHALQNPTTFSNLRVHVYVVTVKHIHSSRNTPY